MSYQNPVQVTPPVDQRRCAWCKAPLQKRHGESQSVWKARRFCNRAHYFAWKEGKPNTATVEGRPIRVKPSRANPNQEWTPFSVGALLGRVCETEADWAEAQRGMRLARQMKALEAS